MKQGPQELVSALPKKSLFCHKKGRSMLLTPSLRSPLKCERFYDLTGLLILHTRISSVPLV